MNGSGFEKVLLSAILTACTVFSVLTLGFLPRQVQPILTEPATGESLEDINQRDVIIRHIGLSIVVSVGAGITTAELLRKWGRSRAVVPDGRQVLSPQTTLQAADMPEMSIAVNGLVTSLQGLTNGMLPAEQLPLQTQSVSAFESDRDATQQDAALLLSLFQPLVPLPTDDINWFPPPQSDSALPALSTELPQTVDWSPTWHSLLTSREQYQTCRIHRSQAPERLFAIRFEDQYYRFVKAASDRERAFQIATRLEQRGEAVVITQMEERYAVWSLELELEACPETTVWQGDDNATCACVEHLVAV